MEDGLSRELQLPSPATDLYNDRLAARRLALLLKRDDLVHPELPGNKWRKLKYLPPDVSPEYARDRGMQLVYRIATSSPGGRLRSPRESAFARQRVRAFARERWTSGGWERSAARDGGAGGAVAVGD